MPGKTLKFNLFAIHVISSRPVLTRCRKIPPMLCILSRNFAWMLDQTILNSSAIFLSSLTLGARAHACNNFHWQWEWVFKIEVMWCIYRVWPRTCYAWISVGILRRTRLGPTRFRCPKLTTKGHSSRIALVDFGVTEMDVLCVTTTTTAVGGDLESGAI